MSFIWKCPTCNYTITNEQFQSAKIDYRCLRCETSLEEFQVYFTKESKQALEIIKEIR